MATDPGFRIHGLKQLDRALGAADKQLRAQLRGEFKQIAVGVAGEAKTIAARRTVTRTGDLVAGIKPFSLMGKAGVRSTAVHDGYEYPRRLEFEGRRGGSFGPRASLWPAVQARRQEIRKGIDQALDTMERAFEKGA
jgi:hypothetical protein